jgi:hypothetical protein
MWNGNNVNDNVNQRFRNNDNDIDRGESFEKSKQVDVIADKLVVKLGAKPDSRPYLCKVAWRLPEHRIWANLEQALKGKNPMGLFIYLSRRDGV